MDGSNRRAVESSRNHPSRRPSSSRQTRTSVERSAYGIQWCALDSRTGAPWQDLPERYGPHQTVHRRFQSWVRTGVLEQVLLAVAQDLKDRGGLDLSECFIDGTFAPAKKGGAASGKQNAGKALKSWQLRTAMVFLSPFARRVLPRLK